MLTLNRNYMKVHGPPVTLFVKFYYDRDVTRISSCWGNTTSRPGIKQLGISSIAAFRLFPSTFIVAEGNPRLPALHGSPATVFLILNRSLFAGATAVASSMQKQLTYRSFLNFYSIRFALKSNTLLQT